MLPLGQGAKWGGAVHAWLGPVACGVIVYPLLNLRGAKRCALPAGVRGRLGSCVKWHFSQSDREDPRSLAVAHWVPPPDLALGQHESKHEQCHILGMPIKLLIFPPKFLSFTSSVLGFPTPLPPASPVPPSS